MRQKERRRLLVREGACRHCYQRPAETQTRRGLCLPCWSRASVRRCYRILADDTRPFCRHCQERRANRPRGLCWRCWLDHGELYPSASKYGKRTKERRGDKGLPAAPTAALAGSPQKVEVLAERIAAGLCPWHPEDEKRLATGGEAWDDDTEGDN